MGSSPSSGRTRIRRGLGQPGASPTNPQRTKVCWRHRAITVQSASEGRGLGCCTCTGVEAAAHRRPPSCPGRRDKVAPGRPRTSARSWDPVARSRLPLGGAARRQSRALPLQGQPAVGQPAPWGTRGRPSTRKPLAVGKMLPSWADGRTQMPPHERRAGAPGLGLGLGPTRIVTTRLLRSGPRKLNRRVRFKFLPHSKTTHN
jgi:hypothetical protein